MADNVFDLTRIEFEKLASQAEAFSWLERLVKRKIDWVYKSANTKPASASTKKVIRSFLNKNGLSHYKVFYDKFPSKQLKTILKSKMPKTAHKAVEAEIDVVTRAANYNRNSFCFWDHGVIVIYGDSLSVGMHEVMHAIQSLKNKKLIKKYHIPGYKSYIERQASNMAIKELKADKKTKSGIDYALLNRAFFSYVISDAIAVLLPLLIGAGVGLAVGSAIYALKPAGG